MTNNNIKATEKEYNQCINQLDSFFGYFFYPAIYPIELFIISTLYQLSNQQGIKFSHDELILNIDGMLENIQYCNRRLPQYSKNSIRYIKDLVKHGFLYYDFKIKKYNITKAGIILGRSLFELTKPEFLHYDEKYMEEIVYDIVKILRFWDFELNFFLKPLSLNISQEKIIQLNEILLKFLKNEQELMNFNQLNAQVIDLNQKAIEIFRNLKITISKLQEDYIRYMNEKISFEVIKSKINIQIKKYEREMDFLLEKNEDFVSFVKKNEGNIESIYYLSEFLSSRLYNVKTSLKLHSDIKNDNNIFDNLERLMDICSRIQEFAFQFNRTVFDVRSERIDSVRFLFQYLQELIQNTQLLGDFYNVWRFGIYNLINSEKMYDLSELKPLNFPLFYRNNIDDIPIADYTLYQIEKDDLKALKERIELRNKEYRKKIAKAKIESKKKMEELIDWNKLVNLITSKILESSGLININKISYGISRESHFNEAKYYPKLLSAVWRKLLEDNKLRIIIDKTRNPESIFRVNFYKFSNNKLIKTESPFVKLKLKQE